MKSARVRRTDDVNSAPARLPVAGKIRPGVKILTPTAAKNAKLVRIYEKGLADGGIPFDEIERGLHEIDGCPKHPLMPRNSPSFRVLQADFQAPGATQTIIDLYGEIRDGDTERKLYSFPIIFPSDDNDIIFREQFEAWRSRERERWSAPGPDGDLHCMRLGEVDAKAKRRQWGGRPHEDLGICDPNGCALFGAGKCKHTASLNFWSPGVIGVGLIELAFTSIYASMEIVDLIDLVRAGLGQVKGTHNGIPIFRISKTHKKVSRIDWETGEVGMAAQWIIRLSADLDMAAVLGGETQPALAAPSTPAALPAPAQTGPVIAPDQEKPAPPTDEAPTDEAPPAPDRHEETARLRSRLSTLVRRLGWGAAELQEYLSEKGYAKEDTHSPDKLTAIIDGLNASIASITERTSEPSADPDVPF